MKTLLPAEAPSLSPDTRRGGSGANLKAIMRALVPAPLWDTLRRGKRLLSRHLVEMAVGDVEAEVLARILTAHGLNVARASDFYSPLPVVAQLKRTTQRWVRPSALTGVRYDLEAMRQRLRHLAERYLDEFLALPEYNEGHTQAFGPGFTVMDAMLLYFMIRDLKPQRCIEVGSGLSTYYCTLAGAKNATEGTPLRVSCIDPYPYSNLHQLSGVDLVQQEVQDVDPSFFQDLAEGDILFVDSTHVVKLDGDVPYLHLEIIPSLRRGVVIHLHDIHFPYNIPYPPEFYVFGRKWPVFWTEAMLVQAFLAYNDAYRITMSLPLLWYSCEEFLNKTLPIYTPVRPADSKTHFGSLWIEKSM